METTHIQEIIDEIATKIAERLNLAVMNDQKNNSDEQGKWFTVEQVCKQLHITKGTLYNHRNKGLITPAKYVGRKPLFNQESINKYLNKFTVE